MLRKIFSLTLSAVLIGMAILPVAASRAGGSSAAQQALMQFTSGGHALGFSADGIYAVTGSHALHVGFAGARHVQPVADAPSSVKENVTPLSRVTYAELWPSITLAYTATAGSIYTTTYTLAPGANPDDIRLRYNAPLTLNADGTLQIAFQTGILAESAPIAWQEINGSRAEVEAAFHLHGQEVSFVLGAYNPQYPLIIDPALVWNAFLGGDDYDYGNAIAVDGSGNIYVAGTSSGGWGDPIRDYTGDYDAFVAKLGANGGLLWHTFLGGSNLDTGHGITVDDSGIIYVVGESGATWGTPKQAYTFGIDSFAAKLSNSGSLLWNTFMGGSGTDTGNGIAMGGSNIYIVGYSTADWGSPVRAYSSGADAYAAKLNSTGSLAWNTFLGGSSNDYGNAIAADGSGNAYLAGSSDATWGSPVQGFAGGARDAFASKVDSSGNLVWNTFLGGSGFDTAGGIIIDGSNNVYLAGDSDATWGSPVRSFNAGSDAFIVKLNPSGSLAWNTFLGGSDWEKGNAIARDVDGNIYLVGDSKGTWGSPIRPYGGGSSDAFAVKVNSSGSLLWNSFLGGSGGELGNGVAVDGDENVYATGYSEVAWGSPSPAFTGTLGNDGFVSRLPKLAFLRSQPDNDGWILETSETSNQGGSMSSTATLLYLGDNAARKQYRVILSFNTTTLPDDAVVIGLTLKIKKQSIVGTNPFTTHGNIRVDIRKGGFGGNNALQPGDFQASASKSAAGTITNTSSGGWYSVTFGSSVFTYIKLDGVTQFRLRFQTDDDNDDVADYFKFHSGDAVTASNRPQLTVEYYVP